METITYLINTLALSPLDTVTGYYLEGASVTD